METIADVVEEMRGALEWTDEANALGDVEYDYDGDDQWGWMTMGPVRVEWRRDPYGDGLEDWVVVSVSVDGVPFDNDACSDLEEAVKDAIRTTVEWQQWCAADIRDEIMAWLDGRDESYDIDTEEDGAWMILWGETCVRGEFVGDGVFQWSVSNSETADYFDGDASDDADAVIEAMVESSRDPMVEAWVETVAVETAEDDWSVRTSEDQMTVYMHSSIAYGVSRRAYYEPVGYEAGRIELEYRVRGSEWRAFDEYLPEDEEDVRRMAREAYAWVKAVDAE